MAENSCPDALLPGDSCPLRANGRRWSLAESETCADFKRRHFANDFVTSVCCVAFFPSS